MTIRQPCPCCDEFPHADYLARHVGYFHPAIARATPAVLDALLRAYRANERPGCGGVRFWLALQELRGIL